MCKHADFFRIWKKLKSDKKNGIAALSGIRTCNAWNSVSVPITLPTELSGTWKYGTEPFYYLSSWHKTLNHHMPSHAYSLAEPMVHLHSPRHAVSHI